MGRHVIESDKTLSEFGTNEVEIDFDVLRSFMEDRVLRDVYRCLAITMDINWSEVRDFQFSQEAS